LIKKEIIKGLLPIVDSFELALKNAKKSKDFIKGLEWVYAQLHSFLKSHNVKPIETVGKKFDPYKHEVLLYEEHDEEDIILEELQKGYIMDDIVIRHAKVKVGRKAKNEKGWFYDNKINKDW